MKTLLLAGALLFAAPSFAQVVVMQPPPPASVPFKKANVILIQTTDSAGVAYRKLAKAFLAAGFALDKTDKDLGYIGTGPRPAGAGAAVTAQGSIEAARTGTVIRLRGTQTNISNEVLIRNGSTLAAPVTFGGMKGSPMRNGWDALQAVAAGYEGATIRYEARP